MKKKLLFIPKVILPFLLGVFIFAACSSDDDDGDTGSKNTAQKQQESIVGALATNQSLSKFTAMFESLDFAASSASEFTVFAVKNDGITGSLTQDIVKRHVVSKAYSLENLKSLSSIQSINGVTLSITTEDSKVFVNGIELGSTSTADKSNIYIVSQTIPSEIVNPDTGYKGLVLNEVCGSQTPDDDWVELYNSSTKAIDISGLQLIKTDETGVKTPLYTIPGKTSISAGEYIVINTADDNRKTGELGPLTAGISNTKQIGISLVESDGKTVIDSFDRDTNIGGESAHILGGSYARLPNGTGNWGKAYVATRGKINSIGELPDVDYSGLIINEICGKQDPDDDWVEIFNGSGKDIDISGVQIIKTDENNIKIAIFAIPTGTTIDAGAYIVINSDNDNRAADEFGPLTGGISNSKQVGIALVQPDGETIINSFDRKRDLGENSDHIVGGSYARLPNGGNTWGKAYIATRGVVNSTGTLPTVNYTGLVLNEINGNDTKYVELYNNSSAAIDISGVIIRKNGSELHTIPSGTSIAAGSTKTFVSDKDGGADFTGGISAKKSLLIELYARNGDTLLDVFKNLSSDGNETWDADTPKYNGETNKQSYGRSPNGTGDWYLMKATQNAANTAGITKIEW